MAEVAAVILAAGGSSRFGRTKQLLEFEGCALIDRAIAAAIGAGCNPIAVVIGCDLEHVAPALADQDVCMVENRDWQLGIGTSIRTGVSRLCHGDPAPQAVVLLSCDQPFVNADLITQLVQQWRLTNKPIVASSYSHTLGIPALFDSSCFDELLQLPDESGAKPIILREIERVAAVHFPEGEKDIDTPDDYRRMSLR